MKKYLLAAGVLLAATPAYAQDPAPVANGGFYAGAHLGYGWTKPDYKEPGFPDYSRNPHLNGIAGGLIAGYELPTNGVALGIEGDVGLLDANAGADDDNSFNDYTSFDTKWNAHVRARVAVPISATTRVFGAAGLALARIEANDTDSGWSSFTRTYSGWTLGAGLEQSLSPRVSARAEFLHDEFGKKHGVQTFEGDAENFYDISLNPSSNLFRLGVLVHL